MSKVYPRAHIHKSLISGDQYPWKVYITMGLNKPRLKFWYTFPSFDEAVSYANRRVDRVRRIRKQPEFLPFFK